MVFHDASPLSNFDLLALTKHSMRLVPLPELMVLGLDAGYDDAQIEN
jgi:hypothetical protein